MHEEVNDFRGGRFTPRIATTPASNVGAVASLPLSRLGERRVGRQLDHPPPQRLHDLALDARVVVHQLAEVLPCQHQHVQRGLGRHRRGALRLLEQRNLADEIAASTQGDVLPPGRNLDLTLEDHEELMAGLALPHDVLALCDLEVLGVPRELGQLLLRKVGEQRRLLERVHLCVLAEQSHDRYLNPARSLSRAANSCHSPGTPLSVRTPRSSNSMLEPAARSRTMLDTSSSHGRASAATRAPMCTAMPSTLPFEISTSPV